MFFFPPFGLVFIELITLSLCSLVEFHFQVKNEYSVSVVAPKLVIYCKLTANSATAKDSNFPELCFL